MADENILIVEDDPQTLRLLSRSLEKAGYKILSATTGAAALELVRQQQPDLIVLDLILPDMNGLEVCREIQRRPETAETLLIMVTALGGQNDKIQGLELGADDYLVKPVDVPELLARIRALFRRKQRGPVQSLGDAVRAPSLLLAGFSIQPERLCVGKGEQDVHLTALEFKLLYQLATHPNKTFSRESLQEIVWETDPGSGGRTVDVLVNRLRSKLKTLEGGEALIRTIRGIGYRFYA